MPDVNRTELPEVFHQVFGLGNPKFSFPVKKINRYGGMLMAMLFFGGAAMAIFLGLNLANKEFQDYGLITFARSGIPLLAGAFLLLLGVLAAWATYTNWHKHAVIYDGGVAYNDRKGFKYLRWDQFTTLIAAVTRLYTNGVYIGSSHIFTLTTKDGDKIKLDDKFEKIEILGKALQEKTFKVFYQRAAELYNAGQTVSFGPLAISKQGIVAGKKALAWKQVAQVSIEENALKIAKKEGGLFSGISVPVDVIPNMHILLAIVDQALRGEPDQVDSGI